MENYWIYTAYLVCATLFILGTKALSHPKKAATGNLLASLGMLSAIIITLCDRIIQYERYHRINCWHPDWILEAINVETQPQMVLYLMVL